MNNVRVIYKLDTLEKMKEQGIPLDVDFKVHVDSKSFDSTQKLLCICQEQRGVQGFCSRNSDYFDILNIKGFAAPIRYELDLDNPDEVKYAKVVQSAIDEVLFNNPGIFDESIIYPKGLDGEEILRRLDLLHGLQEEVNNLLRFRGFETV